MNKKIKGIISTIVVALLIVILQKSGIVAQQETLLPAEVEGSQIIIGVATESEDYKLVRAVDGDTLVVLDNENQEKKVRLIGVNTPETVDPRKPVECFGKGASSFTKELVSKSNKNVRLEFDNTQQKYDKYGRLLAYVYLVQNDGDKTKELFLNRELIKQGYAHEYTYKLPYKFQSEFKELEQEARLQEVGLWRNVCN